MNVRKALFLAIVCLWLVTCLSLVVLFLRPQPAATFQGHTDSIDEVVSSPDGTKLASASRDKTIKLWDVATGKERATLRGHTDRWCHCAFSPDGKTLASSGRSDGTIKLWDVATGQELGTLQRRTDHLVLPGLGASTLGLLGTPSGRGPILAASALFPGRTDRIHCLAFSPDGKTLAAGNENSEVRLWDIATGQERATCKGHKGNLWTIAFSPDSQTLVSGGDSMVVKFWDVATGKERGTCHEHEGFVHTLAFSPDSQTLATGGSFMTVKLWDVATGHELATLQERTNGSWFDNVWCLAFSPDGKTLAAGNDDTKVQLWDIATGKELATWGTYRDEVKVENVAFSPNGKILASMEDDTIRLWDVASGENTATFGQGEDEPGPIKRFIDTYFPDVFGRQNEFVIFHSVWFTPEGKIMVLGSTNRPLHSSFDLKLWEVPSFPTWKLFAWVVLLVGLMFMLLYCLSAPACRRLRWSLPVAPTESDTTFPPGQSGPAASSSPRSTTRCDGSGRRSWFAGRP